MVDFSLVLSTRNRGEVLPRCLEALARLRTSNSFEAIIVDNGSTDGTPEILQQYASNAPHPVSILREEKPGKSRALNLAIKKARGRVLAFFDDDCYLEVDYLDRLSEVFSNDRVGFAGGRILLYDPNDAPLTIRTDDEEDLIPPRSFIHTGAIQGANMAIRKTVIDEIGGFDELLGPGTRYVSGEDVELVARASWAGWTGGYFPGPTVYHHHGRKGGGQVAVAMAGYDYGRGAYLAKFLLRSDSRWCFARHWWWSVKPREAKRLVRELLGAVGYSGALLYSRLAGSTH